MKVYKIGASLLLLALLTPAAVSAEGNGGPTTKGKASRIKSTLKYGQYNEEVRELQRMLSEDSSIYPEGLVTGYFGDLTLKAVNRFQNRHRINENGEVGSKTREMLLHYPYYPFPVGYSLEIEEPNGGEIWETGDTEVIRWDILTIDRLHLLEDDEAEDAYWRRGYTLNLLKDSDSTFRKYIATVDLKEREYEWDIPDSIKPARDYRVEISSKRLWSCDRYYESYGDRVDFGAFPCPVYDIYDSYHDRDVSDEPFAIRNDSDPDDTIKQDLEDTLKVMTDLLDSYLEIDEEDRPLHIERLINALTKQIEKIEEILKEL